MNKNKEQLTEMQALQAAGFTSGAAYDFVPAPKRLSRKCWVYIDIEPRLESTHHTCIKQV